MSKTAKKFVAQALSWLGCNEADGSHKKIIDVYNSHKPLARGYKLQYDDAWCVGFVSAVAIACGFTDIIPTEVGCEKFIKLCKDKGIWIEDENRTPNVGDIIAYDWEDNGTGNNLGIANHVGIVSEVSSDTFKVVEGNKNNAVELRTMKINGKTIRGFAVPKFDSVVTQGEIFSTHTVKKGETLSKIASYYNTTVSELVSLNSIIKNPNSINSGWVLVVPCRVSKPSESVEPPRKDYEYIGMLTETCLNEIKVLKSFNLLMKALEG